MRRDAVDILRWFAFVGVHVVWIRLLFSAPCILWSRYWGRLELKVTEYIIYVRGMVWYSWDGYVSGPITWQMCQTVVNSH